MRKIALALAAALLTLAFHSVAMGLWHDGHVEPFHSGAALLTCPMGYVCPVSPAALKMALTSPTPRTITDLAPLFLVLAAFLYAVAVERARYRPPSAVETSTSPSGLRSTFKKE